MNVLIVYTHHEPSSFAGAMKNIAVQVLEGQGHSVTVSDLYGQGFSAVAQKWDFVTTSGNHFNYMLEQKHAANLQLAFSPDILGEIQKIKAADAILIISPIWWSGVPAILKGWFDRVLAMGVAWDSGKIFENGLLRGKQAMLAMSGAAPADYYQQKGRYQATPLQILHPINHGILAFCGLNVQEPFVALNVLGSNSQGREKALKDWEFRAKSFIPSPQWMIYYG